mmetsp:Transcript_50904/g.114296  ORF Transcript_50904/g.114296 Transcript_50904/m.114296 type:complete len:100 (+) Transcript_50904:161-460(+)
MLRQFATPGGLNGSNMLKCKRASKPVPAPSCVCGHANMPPKGYRNLDSQRWNTRNNENTCFRCGRPGHYADSCPLKEWRCPICNRKTCSDPNCRPSAKK